MVKIINELRSNIISIVNTEDEISYFYKDNCGYKIKNIDEIDISDIHEKENIKNILKKYRDEIMNDKYKYSEDYYSGLGFKYKINKSDILYSVYKTNIRGYYIVYKEKLYNISDINDDNFYPSFELKLFTKEEVKELENNHLGIEIFRYIFEENYLIYNDDHIQVYSLDNNKSFKFILLNEGITYDIMISHRMMIKSRDEIVVLDVDEDEYKSVIEFADNVFYTFISFLENYYIMKEDYITVDEFNPMNFSDEELSLMNISNINKLTHKMTNMASIYMIKLDDINTLDPRYKLNGYRMVFIPKDIYKELIK